MKKKSFSSEIPALYLPIGMLQEGALVALDETERRHARALRLRDGDQVTILDGRGLRATGRIREESGHRRDEPLHVVIERSVLEDPVGGLYIALASGLLEDRSRFESLVEKGVELGCNAFFPFDAERSTGRFRRDRCERIAIAALKQSQRAYLPVIGDPIDIAGILALSQDYDRVVVCHEDPARQSRSLVALIAELEESVLSAERCSLLVVVGPEGGLSDDEVTMLVEQSDAVIVGLGPARLRSETAAIVAMALLRQHYPS